VNTRAARVLLTSAPLTALLAASALPTLVLVWRVDTNRAVELSSLIPALAFALVGAVVSTALGGAIGLAAGTLEVPGRRWGIGVSAALLAAPPAFWWIGLTRLPGGIGRLSGSVAGGCMAGAALTPITLLLVLAATREIPANTYEAARLSLGPVQRLSWVLVPLVAPALMAGFLLTVIVLLGESEIPFLFGFRTAMTDVVTTFSQTFDAGRTAPIVVPLLATVLVIALLMVRPLFAVLLPGARGGRGIIRKPASRFLGASIALLPFLVALALGGYARSALPGGWDVWRRASVDAGTAVVSVAEPVLSAFVALGLALLAAYPARRTTFVGSFAVTGVLLFCVPTAIVAIGWIQVGQVLGGVSIRPGVAYVSRMIGLAVLGFLIAYARLPRSLEDAARLVPLSPFGRAWTLILPLMSASLAAISALAGALIFADRDVASLLLAPGESRLMLNLYLLAANAPSAVVGATALMVFLAGGVVIGLAAAGPALLGRRRRD
jgi:iron(III) transport system permease protein